MTTGKHVGIYVVPPVLGSKRSVRFDPEIIGAPGIKGVLIRVPWRTLQSGSPDVFNGEALIPILDAVRRHDRLISIGVAVANELPDWAETEEFEVGRGPNRPPSKVRIPIPWDRGYLFSYGEVHRLLREFLKREGVLNRVTVIRVAPISVDSFELGLPRPRGEETSSDHPIIRKWFELGYDPNRVVVSYIDMLYEVAKAFPKRILCQATLNVDGFPNINFDGRIEKSRVAEDIVKTTIAQTLGSRFMVLNTALKLVDRRPIEKTIARYRALGARVGWQTNLYEGGEEARAGCQADRDAPTQVCHQDAYKNMLLGGIEEGGEYLEVWPGDVREFPTAIEAVAERLAAP